MRKEYEIVAERLRHLCKEKSISYYSLSYKSTVPISTIMNIVNYHTLNPGIVTLIRLCDGMGISINEFFDTEEFRKIRNEKKS